MSNAIWAVLEQQDGKWHRMSWEALAAAQQLGATVTKPVEAVVLGAGVGPLVDEIARTRVSVIHVIDDPQLARYTPDCYCDALGQLIAAKKPDTILFPHTYQVRDFAPKLAVRLGRPLLSDCIGFRAEADGLVFTRPLFQGKLNADVSFAGPPPYLLSIQAGNFSADAVARSTSQASIEAFEASIATPRTTPEAPFKEAKGAVDLSQADLIVAVGRGIKEQENLALVQKLADVLGAELAGSRPICDNGWLPMERQVGSSGQTVAPKLYLAVGISGAIQHLVGMKGSRTIVAINKDANAPIFEVADYAIVGNLFDVIPPLIEEITKLKAR